MVKTQTIMTSVQMVCTRPVKAAVGHGAVGAVRMKPGVNRQAEERVKTVRLGACGAVEAPT
jgi:hypothetical protein